MVLIVCFHGLMMVLQSFSICSRQYSWVCELLMFFYAFSPNMMDLRVDFVIFSRVLVVANPNIMTRFCELQVIMFF